MSKSKLVLTASLTACLLVFGGLFVFAQAQEDAPTTTDEGTTEDVLLADEMGPPPEEVVQDMEVTADDLGAKPAIIRPGNILHPFKRLGRNIFEMVTLNPFKDARLKLKHANQELSEMKQVVDDKGMENVNPKDLVRSVEWFEGKIEKIKNASEKLKDKKEDQPDEIEALLNDLTDKQFKEHKVLEGFHSEITEHKDEIDGAEDVFAVLKDKQNNVLKHFGETLTVVDEPERIPERLSDIANEQEGSGFKLIKAAEILEKLEEQMPDEAKEAIEQAQEKTLEKLQGDVGELPAIVRAEKFEAYANALPGDEAVQLGIFEKIKQLPDVPQDILEKIEEIKEFAVKRFEDKIEKFEQPEVKDKFFEGLQGDDMDDIIALEELKAKITAKQEELKARIEAKHAEGVEAFKKQFTDVKSQDQAERFERLVKELVTNLNPTTLKLIKGLEEEVVQDPEKRAFIEDIKNKTKAEFENKFRLEGDRFFDRMATFNPEDMMIFREFEEEKFFDSRMIDKFYDHQTDTFKEHIQRIESPEMFNRFDERMRFAPPEVVDMIKTRDAGFGEVMQFKARRMMEAELELKEREMRLAIERAWRDSEDDFQILLRQARSDEEKQRLYEEKRERDFDLMEKEFEERRIIMEARFESDPFCDNFCQAIQREHLAQDLQHRTWELKEDARMREFQMEMEMRNRAERDPFAGKCYDPGSCLSFCKQNPDFPACRVHGLTSTPIADKPLSGPCPPGQVNIQTSPGHWICSHDPYYKPPEFFKDCPPGHFWNEQQSFCQFDESYPTSPVPSVNFCAANEYWDNMRGCVRDDARRCPVGEFFDFFENRCVPEWKSCPPGEYWAPGRQGCVRDIIVRPDEECPPDHFFDFFKKQCVKEVFCPTIMPRHCQPDELPAYGECGPSCILIPVQCPPGDHWDEIQGRCVGGIACLTHWDPVCGTDGKTYSNECFAGEAGVGIKYRGDCGGRPCGSNVCGPGEECLNHEQGLCCQKGQVVCPDNGCAWSMTECPGMSCGAVMCGHGENCVDSSRGWCCPYGQVACSDGRCVWSDSECGTTGCNYNGVCDHNETNQSCPKDCGVLECLSCYCGNGICEIDESISSCSDDCGGEYGGTCGYTFEPSGAHLDISASSFDGLTFSIKQITNDCTNDNVTLELVEGDGAAVWLCTVDAPNISFSGIETKTVHVSCAPSGMDIGYHQILLRTDSAANRAHGMSHPYNSTFFTVNVEEAAAPVATTTPSGYCGDGACNNSETTSSCPSDCIGPTVEGGTCYPSGGHGCDGDTQLYCYTCSEADLTIHTHCKNNHVAGDTIWQFSQYCSTTNRECRNGYCKAICGDGICGTYETAGDCPGYNDCVTATTTPSCGDGACSSGNGETADNCPGDCQGNYCGGTYCPLGKVCADAVSQTCCNSGEYFCNNGCSVTDCALPQCEEGAIPSTGCICQGINKFEGNCCYSIPADALVWTTVPCAQTCTSMGGVCCYGAASDCDEWSNQWATDCQGYVCCTGRCATATYCGDGVCDSDEDSSSCPDDCAPACTDSDGGVDYQTQGIATGIYAGGVSTMHFIWGTSDFQSGVQQFDGAGDTIYYDHCANDVQANEGFCGSDGRLHSTSMNCPNGCQDGVCLAEPAKSITVTSPSAGAQWVKGNTYTIGWQYGGWDDSQYVHTDVCSGSGCFTLFSQNDGILVSSGGISWTIGNKWPDLAPGDSWYIRVFLVPIGWEQGVDYDKSDYFSISEAGGGGASILRGIERFFQFFQRLFGF